MMGRIAVALAAVALAASPARAAVLDVNLTGSVILPVATPTIPRVLYNAGVETNLIAVVFRVGEAADGATYTLTKTGGIGNLDAYFYTDAGGAIGDICNPVPEDELLEQDVETGRICPLGHQTAGWGIVLLRWGANASFSIDW